MALLNPPESAISVKTHIYGDSWHRITTTECYTPSLTLFQFLASVGSYGMAITLKLFHFPKNSSCSDKEKHFSTLKNLTISWGLGQ